MAVDVTILDVSHFHNVLKLFSISEFRLNWNVSSKQQWSKIYLFMVWVKTSQLIAFARGLLRIAVDHSMRKIETPQYEFNIIDGINILSGIIYSAMAHAVARKWKRYYQFPLYTDV